jgi:hypothetical protein
MDVVIYSEQDNDNLKIHYAEQVGSSGKFFLIGIAGGGVQLGPLGTAAINGLLCQSRVIMMMEKLVE